MKTITKSWKRTRQGTVSLIAGLLSLGAMHSVHAANDDVDISQIPLFLEHKAKPLAMLNMSNDHQLFFKAYDDYSDLDGSLTPDDPSDDAPDTTYMNDYEYYGYFDSDKCYSYDTNTKRFSPSYFTADHYCTGGPDGESGDWSGNFLNWATMTRMDSVRKILYGGKRAVDSATLTVLERALLPQDGHSFAKYYNGDDLSQLTPFSVESGRPQGYEVTDDGETDTIIKTGITMCNTTAPSSRTVSQDTDAPPLMQVAQGNFSLWASNEGWQCRWGQGSNGNDPDLTGIYAYDSSPTKSEDGLGQKDYVVRVEVCDDSVGGADPGTNNEKCVDYGDENSTILKPTGLLQKYKDRVKFGLITGSYSKNKSGGTLRRNISSFTDELADNGTFTAPGNGEVGIVGTLDRLRIYGYDFGDGQYNDTDDCSWGLASFSNGDCTNWGNPQSEIYLESLRYLAGLTPSFAADDSNYIDGLGSVSWVDPIDDDNACAPLSVIQFNASTSSYGGNELSGFTALAGSETLDSLTNDVGVGENLTTGEYFVGSDGDDETDQLCTPKSISNLSDVSGTCPNAPRLGGSYQIAGMAYGAHTNGIANDRKTVTTHGVSLAPAVPKVEIPISLAGVTTDSITILPACRNNNIGAEGKQQGNCAIVDFKIVEQNFVNNTGTLYVNWEDSEQGGDFDQDMWGIIEYDINELTSEITVSTQVIAKSTNFSMGFGYVIGGTTDDGFHVQSGINNFEYGESCVRGGPGATHSLTNCSCRLHNYAQSDDFHGVCNINDEIAKRSKTFAIGGSSAQPLEQPLYYAAKWGGFDYEDGTSDPKPEVSEEPGTYYAATDPRQLYSALNEAFKNTSKMTGAAATVATSSTRLDTDTYVFQATFNAEHWSGNLKAIPVSGDAAIDPDNPDWEAATHLTSSSAATRNIFTYNLDDDDGVTFAYNNLGQSQKDALDGNDSLGSERVEWVKGIRNGGLLREREAGHFLGDIVNSNPVFAGDKDYGYSRYGVDGYQAHVAAKDTEMVYVGANDGMLHAFDAANGGREEFAYIPSGVYSQLHDMTLPDYGVTASNSHQFSVDGPLYVGDAYFAGQWRTLLVGTLGAGGKGFYVLDVSDPDNFTAQDVLFEVTPDTVGDAIDQHIGQIFAQPVVAPITDSNWAIIVGNGYNSTSGKAGLLVVTADNNGVPSVEFIGTDNTLENGLSEPSLHVAADGTVDYAYAGDLKGRMWKFDLADESVAITDADGNNAPLFTATGPSPDPNTDGAVQPITSAPVLGLNPQKRDSGGRAATMVYFGTGRYLGTTDLTDTAVQSFYGVADDGNVSNLKRENMYDPHNDFSQSGATRTMSEQQAKGGTLDWTTAKGWLLDFDEDTGERVVEKAQLLFDRLIFPTVVPTTDLCENGGYSWTMELVGVGNIYPGHKMLDEQGIKNQTLVSLSNLILDRDNEGTVIEGEITGSLKKEPIDIPPGAFGRQSWRQLR